MNQEDIKTECDKMYTQIQQAQNKLKEIRLICKHPNKFIGDYFYRVGAVQKAEICSDCGEPINFL